MSKLKKKTLGGSFAAVFWFHGMHKAKNHWKAPRQSCQGERGGSYCRAQLQGPAQRSAAPVPAVLGPRDRLWCTGCQPGTALCAARAKQFICRGAKRLLFLHDVFNENGLLQNEDFLRKIVPFRILFAAYFVDRDPGFGIAFFPIWKIFSFLLRENWRQKHGSRVNKKTCLWKFLGKTPQKIHPKVPGHHPQILQRFLSQPQRSRAVSVGGAAPRGQRLHQGGTLSPT